MSDPMLALRPATDRDANAIWAILKPVFRAGDTYTIDPAISREDAIAYWTAHHPYVAVLEGQTLGTFYIRPNQQGGGAHVCNAGFATHPDARGKGIAQAMLDHALAEAPRLGFRAMQFNFVVTTNAGAIRLWDRAGFATVGRLPDAFKHPEKGYVDALVMWKDL